ncbi:MAG: hypothetical protein M3R51_04525 [Candidatus Eremiobacteraeota bacterium]|nr:hypothetical protein [Candidatus Eremiobacteraeota bacterium]
MIQFIPLALALTIGASAAATPAIAPGTYTYAASSSGSSVGTSVVTVAANGADTVISEKGSGTAQGQSGNAADTLTLGADLAPTAYQLSGTVGARSLNGSATFANNTATVTGLNGTKSFDLLGSTKHFIVIDLGVLAGFIALPAQMAAWNDTAALAVIPSYGTSIPIAPDASLKPARPATVASGDTALAFGGQIPFTIWYNPRTYVTDEIDVPAQSLTVIRK